MRTSWQIQQAVIKALFIREIKTRFATPLGYAWAVLGPFLQVMVLVIIFSFISRNGYQGLAFALFFTPGILLLNFFTQQVNNGSATIQANKGLFNYKQVKPFDAFVTRALIEFALLLVSSVVIFSGFIWYGYEVPVVDPLTLMAIFCCMAAMGFGFSILFGCISLYFKDMNKIVSLMTRPLFFISCIIYPLIVIPSEYHYLFLWNPLVHAVELVRVSLYPYYIAPGVNIGYLFFVSLSVSFLGVLAYRRHWQQMVASR